MRNRNLVMALAAFLVAAGANGATVSPCGIEVRAEVELRGQELSAADLITEDSCSRVRVAATRLRLGRAPLQGSVRVFGKREVEETLSRVVRDSGMTVDEARWRVPERVEVRGARLTQERNRVGVGAHGRRHRLESLVVRGQRITLDWEEAGMHSVAPAVCLDAGNAGDTVRARVAGGAVLQARVVSAGRLRKAP